VVWLKGSAIYALHDSLILPLTTTGRLGIGDLSIGDLRGEYTTCVSPPLMLHEDPSELNWSVLCIQLARKPSGRMYVK
jgi:hypothetical protein